VNIKPLACIAFVLSSLFLIFFFLQTHHIKFNYTSSMPIGFYQRIPTKTIHRGDYVSVCLPDVIVQEGLHRGYLARGSCKSGVAPVLKQVIALPGDIVELSNHSIRVNHHTYFAPRIKYDHQHQLINYFVKPGIYHTKKYWLYGSNNPTYSWDSRYFGGMGREEIGGVWRNFA